MNSALPWNTASQTNIRYLKASFSSLCIYSAQLAKAPEAMENKKKNSLKPTKKSKKHSKSKVIEDVRTNEERKKEIYTKIFAKTGLPEDEIIDAHEKFDEDYPQGKITKEEFNEQSEVNTACIKK